jgi:signal transduction histidine kinase/CheY-like chemotaxis protein
MNRIKSFFEKDTISEDLLRSTALKITITVGGLYLFWHFVASLSWPEIFSPSLWVITILFGAVFTITLWLMKRSYFLSQMFWIVGLGMTIFQAYHMYLASEIVLLVAILPLIAVVTMGHMGAFIVEILVIIAISAIPDLGLVPTIPQFYQVAIVFLSIFCAIFGWALSDDLLSAISDSAYHYREARKRLKETRQHRAEISRMLKEQSQLNYQLKQMNKMLSYARAKADEAREERDRFAMAVSHELRSPLNFIIGFSDLMVNSPETYAKLVKWPSGLYDDIQEIYQSSQHLMDLINDILDMGKIDAHHMPLFREKIALDQLMDQVIDMVSPSIEQKGLQLKTEIEEHLPALFVDCTRVRQVMLNILTNSLRHTIHGGITIKARQKSDDFIEVQIADTGVGISPEDMEKIFVEFRQVGQENWQRGQGTGLGLAISRRFVMLHGGNLWGKSELGKGTAFYFTLPVWDPIQNIDFTQLPLDQENGSPTKSAVVDQQQLVLFYSDKNDSAKLAAQYVVDYQALVVPEVGLLERMVNEYYPRAVIIDEHAALPEPVRNFLDNPSYDLPVIFVSFPQEPFRASARLEGVQNHLVKPVPRDVLVEAVRDLGEQVKHLLVVDDDPTMVRYLTQSLRSASPESGISMQYEFITAFNGQEALAALEKHDIDAVILDLELPDIHGVQLLGKIRQQLKTKKIPVVVVSASDLPQMMPVSQKHIFNITLNRPFFQQELISTLKAGLDTIHPIYVRTTDQALPKSQETPFE